MKKLIIVLLCISFVPIRAMYEEKNFNANEYHKSANDIVSWFNKYHDIGKLKEVLLFPEQCKTKETAQKILIKRKNGKFTEDVLKKVTQLNLETTQRTDGPQGGKDALVHLRWLCSANEQFQVKSQQLDTNGDLITEFEHPENMDTLCIVYGQITGVLDVQKIED